MRLSISRLAMRADCSAIRCSVWDFSIGYEMQGNIGQLGKEMALAQNSTNMTIMQTGNGIQAQLAECCCTTQRAIDGVNANIEAKLAAREKSQMEQRIAERSPDRTG